MPEFINLPSEIRCMIYDQLFFSVKISHIRLPRNSLRSRHSKAQSKEDQVRSELRGVEILLVSKLCRQEALESLQAHAIITLRNATWRWWDAKLPVVPDSLHHVKHIEIEWKHPTSSRGSVDGFVDLQAIVTEDNTEASWVPAEEASARPWTGVLTPLVLEAKLIDACIGASLDRMHLRLLQLWGLRCSEKFRLESKAHLRLVVWMRNPIYHHFDVQTTVQKQTGEQRFQDLPVRVTAKHIDSDLTYVGQRSVSDLRLRAKPLLG